jgi:hypothetical protein
VVNPNGVVVLFFALAISIAEFGGTRSLVIEPWADRAERDFLDRHSDRLAVNNDVVRFGIAHGTDGEEVGVPTLPHERQGDQGFSLGKELNRVFLRFHTNVAWRIRPDDARMSLANCLPRTSDER